MKIFEPVGFRQAFPALQQPTVYLDSASTALKPQTMIEAITAYYATNTATAYRSLHPQAQETTRALEQARLQVADLLHASSFQQIVWTKGVTESLNLIAQSYARSTLQAGDEIIVSELEHHSNLIPWLIVAQQTGAKVIKWQVDSTGSLSLHDYQQCLSTKTKIVAISQMSNVTGYAVDIEKVIKLAHKHSAVVVVDAAQGIVHHPLNVTELDIDFYAFSAHKLYGPTGLGVLYAKTELLAQMPVWHGGGKMLKTASFAGFEALPAPQKFEAGTPDIAGIIGFNAVLDWYQTIDWQQAEQYTCHLAELAEQRLSQMSGFTSYRAKQSTILSFTIKDIHHSDLALLLAEQHIAIRTGELCAQPLIKALGVSGVIRASFMPYNNASDVELFVTALQNALVILTED
ncbi:cysteine desulfurase CsdA [Zophobihabitans entericus]|uniref:Probable cysteine desulfurase n=1 Tax=Zophobihabitans entericus TaxID=1635327 RepID=A0A6G9I8X0_9GAMM|nr:cysteine desulfurase CsdA [Zophobihabitans entericus]QIQ20272.1 cysteine desulfurase CsdA [Zophobihabitans entericus]